MRLWWEDVYRAPSHGNPAFEGVALADHVAHLTAKHVRAGGGVFVKPDGGLELTKEPVPVTTVGAHFTGDPDCDTMERRLALGLDAVADEEPPHADAG